MTVTQIFIEKNYTLMSLDNLSVGLITYGCRRGMCGKCVIKVIDNNEILHQKSDIEDMTLSVIGKNLKDFRLACQCQAKLSGLIEISAIS